MKDTVDKCLAFCQALAKDNRKFSISLTMGKDNFHFSTSDQRRKVPARQDVDLKKGASSRQRRREERATDPVVRQKAAAHAAAEEAAAAAGATGEAARRGSKCSNCHLPTKGHTTGRAGPQCTALPSPERARGSSL